MLRIRIIVRMLTLQQLKMRQTGITATDVVSIVGENPWSSASSVYEDKFKTDAQLLEGNERMQDRELNGLVFEEALAQRYLLDLPKPAQIYAAAATYRATDCDWALATPDRFVFDGAPAETSQRVMDGGVADWLLECKLVGTRAAKGWDLDEAAAEVDQIPSYVYTQVQWQLRVLGYRRCDVAALLYGTTFRRFRVERDDGYIDAISEIAEDFWKQCVQARRPPPPDGTKEYSDFLSRRFPSVLTTAMIETPEGAVPLVQRFETYRRIEQEAKKEKDKAGQALQMLVGSAMGFEGPWGSVKCTSKRGRVDMQKLMKAQNLKEEALDAYRKPPDRALYVRVAKTKEEVF